MTVEHLAGCSVEPRDWMWAAMRVGAMAGQKACVRVGLKVARPVG